MRCDICGTNTAAVDIEMGNNIGMLIRRRSEITRARVCRHCLNRVFGRHMLANLTLGWWGTISFFMTIHFTVKNITEYFRASSYLKELSVHLTRTAADNPHVENAEEKLEPFRHTVKMRLLDGEDSESVAHSMAEIREVSLQQACDFVDEIKRRCQ